MEQNKIDEMYMRRCLQLAKNGRQNAKPNPMVGAVIVSEDGRIIGEGYHVRCGEGHAEVNAFASVRPEDEHLLPGATIYVSLEPAPIMARLLLRRLGDQEGSAPLRMWLRGPLCPGARPWHQEDSQGWHRGYSGRTGAGMPGAEQAIHHLQYPPSPLHHPEMGANCQWLLGQ